MNSGDSPTTRIGAALLLTVIAVLLIVGVMTVQRGFIAQNERRGDVERLRDAQQLASQIRFLSARLDAAQSRFALEALGASSITDGARGALRSDQQNLSAALKKLSSQQARLEGNESASFKAVQAAFTAFQRSNAEVQRLFTDRQRVRATKLLLEQSKPLSGQMGESARRLEADVGLRSSSAIRNQENSNRDLLGQLILFSSAVAVSLVLMLVLLVVGYQQRSGLIQRLKWQVSTDGLTGVSNRRAWEGGYGLAMARAVRSGQTLSVVMLDLDHFKRFNDTYGHAAGDKLLRFTAQLLLRSTRVTDIVARYGGEEFALCLEGCSAEDAQALLERIKGQLPGGSTFSAGIAITDGNETPAAVLERADKALYGAKRAGRNRIKISAGANAPATRDSNVTLVAQASATT
jgi:diguanylate cyclase (GGDEF)-like protein